MTRQMSMFRIVVVICLLLTLCSAEAFAWGGHGGHYYRGGRWYRSGWFGLDVAVAALTIGALVNSLPPSYNTVVVGGVPYYYYDGYYYRPCPQGYVVVPPPVVTQPIIVQQQPVVAEAAPMASVQAAPMQTQASTDLVVNIPNSRGGYTSVTLQRHGNGYIGPQGEYYTEHPTVDELKALYGK